MSRNTPRHSAVNREHVVDGCTRFTHSPCVRQVVSTVQSSVQAECPWRGRGRSPMAKAMPSPATPRPTPRRPSRAALGRGPRGELHRPRPRRSSAAVRVLRAPAPPGAAAPVACPPPPRGGGRTESRVPTRARVGARGSCEGPAVSAFEIRSSLKMHITVLINSIRPRTRHGAHPSLDPSSGRHKS